MRTAALLLLGIAAATPALACGYCVEDKIAAAYDHAVVSRALGAKHHVAFFHIDGTLPAEGSAARKLEALAESVTGVDGGSARVSVKSAVLAVAFDPARVRFAALLTALDGKLAPRKLSLLPLRVMERTGELKVAKP